MCQASGPPDVHFCQVQENHLASAERFSPSAIINEKDRVWATGEPEATPNIFIGFGLGGPLDKTGVRLLSLGIPNLTSFLHCEAPAIFLCLDLLVQ